MRSPAAQSTWLAATISAKALPGPGSARQAVFASPVAASATRMDQGSALGFGWNRVVFMDAGTRRNASRVPSGDQAGSLSSSTLGAIQRSALAATS